MIAAQISALVTLCLLLIYATSLIVRSLKNLARAAHLGAYGLTAFILAISTSLPELVVSLVAAAENNTSLILGNIIGSNIADLTLVIGGATLLGGSLKVSGTILSRDIYLTGAAGLLPIFLVADGTLAATDGIVLLVVYAIMVTTFLRSHQRSLATHSLSTSPSQRILALVTRPNGHDGALFKFIFGVLLLLVSSHFIVQLATALSISSGLSNLFIGLFIVSVGTSLPELAFEIKAVITGHADMALGDLLGSVIANSTLILGLSSLISPLTLTHRGLWPYTLALLFFTLIFALFTQFVKSKKRLEWWEGLILLCIYLIFVLVEYWSQQASIFG